MKARTLFLAICTAGCSILSGGAQEELDFAKFIKTFHAISFNHPTNILEVVDLQALKPLLPATIDGLKRTNLNARKTHFNGVHLSCAQAIFTSEQQTNVLLDVKISDMGGLGGLSRFKDTSWVDSEIDHKSEYEFERTTVYQTFKAMETYNRKKQEGTIGILVGNRFMVDIHGHHVTLDKLRTIARGMELEKLARLAVPKP